MMHMQSKMNGSWLSGRSLGLLCLLCAGLSAACEKTEEQPAGTAAPLEQAMPAPTIQPAPPAVTPPAGAKVFFIEPVDGAEVKGPLVDGKVAVTIKMGVENVAVQAAGKQIPGTGHHHLVIDDEHIALGSVVPKDETHIHYGLAQTETSVMLAPGEHNVTMQFADGAHLSYGPQLSAVIKIKVLEDAAAAVPATKDGAALKGKKSAKAGQ